MTSSETPADLPDDGPGPAGSGWRRLDVRTVLASSVLALGACLAGGVPTLAGMRQAGGTAFTVAAVLVVGGTILLVGLAAVLEYVRLERTRFRIGADRVELHTGIVVRTRKGLARERVRTVEVTADPVLRLLGLATLRIGTGQRSSATDRPLELRALRRADAESVRRELLDRDRPDEAEPSLAVATPRGDETLAVLDPGWIRFAPISALTPALGVAAFGAVLQGADWIGLQRTVLDETVAAVQALGFVVSLLVGLVVVVVVGTVGSLAVFVESWWAFRLTREAGAGGLGSLHVRRGLLTTRSTTLEENRLRGVAVIEPLGARALGAARLDAVATGLSHADGQRSDPKGLLPVAPLAVVERVVADVLREPAAPTAQVTLRPHPPAARRRRLRWGCAAGLVPAVVVAVLALGFGSLTLTVTAAVLAVVGIVVGVRLGIVAHRNLGHGLVGTYVVSRHGAPGRRTVALRRDGILTWSVSQTVFQRRAGLATLWFTTAAGDGRYGVFDLTAADAVAFAVETLGDQLEPFLSVG
ncbi:PH domain-containing protein [Actinomycetospora atypica]|uniref:PH domain-containing protein n=1 Tax=Actinomycetospora atypica TaxID=1290095 RepID=A0ABV9YRF1_9PSEU